MSQKMAFFDFDDTLIKGDSIKYLLHYYIKKHPLSVFRLGIVGWRFLVHKITKSPINKAKSALLFPVGKMTNAELQEFFKLEIEPRYYPNVVAELKQKKQEGYVVYIVSASVEAYLRYCELPVDCIMGTKVAMKEGRYTNQMIGKNCKNEEKVHRILSDLEKKRITIDYEQSYGYSDSEHDIPMLKMVKNRIRINTDNGEMSPFVITE